MRRANFWTELKRRNVYKVLVAYLVTAWLVIQAASTLLVTTFQAPHWVLKVIVLTLILGLPVALVLSWAFEITPEGIERTEKVAPQKSTARRTGRRLVGLTVLFAALATGLFIYRSIRQETPVPELNSTVVTLAAVPEKSIAVLPFENLSSDKENAYFTDGIQDEILTKLSRIDDLKVISRTSTAKYKSKPEDLRTAAQQLGVAHILEGSVQRTADKVHVTVQLIDARADAHLWAESYDRELKDVFAVESEVSQKIANSLQAKLSPAEAKNLTSTPTQDSEAYDFFLKGEYAEYEAEVLLKAESFDRAAAAYEQALARDPNFALAAARLVVSRSRRHFFISQSSEAELNELKKLADRTVTLAPSLPEAHIALATFYYLGRRQYDDALTELQRALELQPNNVGALILSGYVHRRQGQWKRGLSEMLKAETRDPRNPQLAGNIAGAYCSLRMWDDARRFGLRALAIDPHSILGLQSAIFSSLNGKGDIVEAKRTAENYSPAGRLAEFTVLGSMPIAAYLKVIERDFTGALQLCESEIADPAENRSRLAARAAIHLLAGDTATAQSEIGHARELLESRLRERPDDFVALLQLSWVNVAFQRHAEALRLAQRATELLPSEKDALQGPTYLACLAEIQARSGEGSEAIKTLQRLLSMPIGYFISIQQLKIDPVWDPIRNNPGFQRLLVGKEQIGPNK